MFPTDDKQFEETTIKSVSAEKDGGWSIERADGWSFFVPMQSPVVPMPGMLARFYGRGTGYTVRGLFIDGQRVFYKTPEEQAAEDAARSAEYKERQAKIALEPKLPVPQIEGFEWTEDMHEISGFGGGYERACRAMVSAGCKWLTDNPTADPNFHGYKGIYGVISEDNDDAKALTKVVIDAAGGDASGAMHQASIGHIMFWKRERSWPVYQAEMRKPREEDAA